MASAYHAIIHASSSNYKSRSTPRRVIWREKKEEKVKSESSGRADERTGGRAEERTSGRADGGTGGRADERTVDARHDEERMIQIHLSH